MASLRKKCYNKTLDWEWKYKAIRSKTNTIGIFDSGVGGLTVYKELVKKFPFINIIYIADTKRHPYGPRPQKQVAQFSKQIINYLISKGCGLVIIACNTATAAAFDNKINKLKIFKNIPIFGPIIFGAQESKRLGKNIAVLGTEGTINSKSYAKAIGPNYGCIEIACPKFATIVENGKVDDDKTEIIVKKNLQPIINLNIDSLIFGCTHYPILEPVIRKVLKNKQIKYINPAIPLVNYIIPYLEISKKPYRKFIVTKNRNKFIRVSENILGYSIKSSCSLKPNLFTH